MRLNCGNDEDVTLLVYGVSTLYFFLIKGVLVPSSVDTLSNPVSNCARFLLIVEKDATFQRLLRDKLPSVLDCIMITVSMRKLR